MLNWPPKDWVRQGNLESASGSERRAAIIKIATAMIGMGPRQACYRDAIFPWDTPDDAQFMVDELHKCVLTALTILRAAGYRHSKDEIPFRQLIGKSSINAQVNLLLQMKEWEYTCRLPLPGEVYMVHSPANKDLLHCCTCLGYLGKNTIVSADGTIPDVYRSERLVVMKSGKALINDNRWNREMLGILHTEELELSMDWYLPPGKNGK